MKPYKLIIFDWDGTLMDSADKIVSCMQLAAKACDLPVPESHAVKHIIGISLKPAIQQLFNLSDIATTERVVLAYKQAYVEKDATPCPLFAGVEELLRGLHSDKRILAVATGKARRGLDRAWKNTGTGHFFSASRTADEANSKPSPDMLLQILQETGISADDAVMVGDTSYDMQMAQAIGMDRIGVSYGVHAQVNIEAHHPVEMVHSVPELEKYLLQYSVQPA